MFNSMCHLHLWNLIAGSEWKLNLATEKKSLWWNNFHSEIASSYIWQIITKKQVINSNKLVMFICFIYLFYLQLLKNIIIYSIDTLKKYWAKCKCL